MEKLLPYFERELGMLRRASQEFAERYPKLAGDLMLSGEVCADPHVERLIQSVALLNARSAMRLDNDYAGFTEALLGTLYPHYLRPIPACSIARVDNGPAPATVVTVPRGTVLKSPDGTAVLCKFRTAYEVAVAPVRISAARFESHINAPPSLRLPADVTASINITIAHTAGTGSLAELGLPALRVFIDGEASLRAALRDTLFMRIGCACVEAEGQWRMLDKVPLRSVGFHDSDALLPFSPAEQPAYRLLSEYFSFPEKFDFFDIDLQQILQHTAPGCASFTLHLALNGVRADSNACSTLRALARNNLLLFCTPVINLFRHIATPIAITHAQSSYPLMPDAMPANASEIYSIDSVRLLQHAGRKDSIATEFVPYYALRHGESPSRKGHYWIARRDEELAAGNSAHEYSLTLVDRDFDPLTAETGTASIAITCTNRDLPHELKGGPHGSELAAESAAIGLPIRLLRKPTVTQRMASGRGAQWGLISHLSLNHRKLTQEGLAAFTAMLRLYVLPDSPVSQRQIDGVTGLSHRLGTAWLRRGNGRALLSGVEIVVMLDEEAYAGTGIHLFIELLDNFLGLYVHMNSYTQLTVLSHATGKELLRCAIRNGSLPLA
ncbi:type VI secretion system baseplate subunit TssF [Pseudoduganella sp. LjRoot289]|uniref:type VI secretion system baseplate subunit TssF n=1 Tax=Pseudoduganella sp. LjRoot289 TaxID=3342314 RepID=UPI003ECE3CE3